MTVEKTIQTVAITLVIVIAVPAGMFFRKPPAPQLPPSEKELAGFSDVPVSLSSQPSHTTFAGRTTPVSAPARPAGPALPGVSSAPVPTPSPAGRSGSGRQRSLASLPVVSVISYDGSSRTAIVDNHVVTEGSRLDSGIIVKIEETRVLLRRGGKDVWLTTN